MRQFSARYFSAMQARSKPYSLLFFGSDAYSKATLYSMLMNPGFKQVAKRVAVVSPPVAGPNTASESFHDLLKEHKIEKFTFRKQLDPVERYIKSQEEHYEYPFDVAVVASFNKRLPDKILNLFPQGVLVAHPSLLPKYRGACPIEHCVLNKETRTGVSIVEASKEKIGAGKIFLQRECDILPNDGYLQLAGKCGGLAGEALVEVLADIEKFREEAKPQSDGKEVRAPLIGKEQAILLWDKLTAAQAVRKHMALYMSPRPAFTKIMLQGKWHYVYLDGVKEETYNSLEYYRKVLAPVDRIAAPGDIHWSARGMKERICIKCAEGWVSAEQVKIEGQRSSMASTFISTHLRNEHYDAGKKFVHHFATSKDIIKIEQKIEI